MLLAFQVPQGNLKLLDAHPELRFKSISTSVSDRRTQPRREGGGE